MFEFHKNKPKYFQHQYLTARDYIVPFVEEDLVLNDQTRVLEIGCAEAGVGHGACRWLPAGCLKRVELSAQR